MILFIENSSAFNAIVLSRLLTTLKHCAWWSLTSWWADPRWWGVADIHPHHTLEHPSAVFWVPCCSRYTHTTASNTIVMFSDDKTCVGLIREKQWKGVSEGSTGVKTTSSSWTSSRLRRWQWTSGRSREGIMPPFKADSYCIPWRQHHITAWPGSTLCWERWGRDSFTSVTWGNSRFPLKYWGISLHQWEHPNGEHHCLVQHRTRPCILVCSVEHKICGTLPCLNDTYTRCWK